MDAGIATGHLCSKLEPSMVVVFFKCWDIFTVSR